MTNLDQIVMENVTFYAYHGVFPEENRLGQRFHLDLTLDLPLQKAGETDDLQHSVNYAELYEIMKDVVTGERYKLLESIGERICDRILKQYPIVERVQCTVRKPEAPIAGVFDYVAIKIVRGRP